MPVLVKLEEEGMNIFEKSYHPFNFIIYDLAVSTTGDQYGLCECL